MIRQLCLAAALALCLPTAGAVLAGGTEASRSGDHRDRTGGVGLSPILTGTVADQLRIDLGYCGRVTEVYAFDCSAYALRLAAQAVDGNPAYRNVEAALRQADRDIRLAVRADVDRGRLPRLNGLQYYRPVRSDAVPALRALTAQSLADAAAGVRRAPDQSGDPFARIAGSIAQAGQSLEAPAD